MQFDIKAFCKLIIEKRILKKISCEELAQKIGLSYALMYRIEKGRIIPTPKIINQLCGILEISKEELSKNVDKMLGVNNA